MIMVKNKEKLKLLVLTPALQKLVDAGIVAAATKYAIELGGQTSFHLHLEDGHYHGNKALKLKSVDTYKAHYKQLWIFLADIGDFESMLLLVTPKLKDLPSMNVSSLSAFLRYKKMARGTVLTATDDSQPLT